MRETEPSPMPLKLTVAYESSNGFTDIDGDGLTVIDGVRVELAAEVVRRYNQSPLNDALLEAAKAWRESDNASTRNKLCVAVDDVVLAIKEDG